MNVIMRFHLRNFHVAIAFLIFVICSMVQKRKISCVTDLDVAPTAK